ncbi:uncharacterized protein C7orf73 homolog isoform X1 [Heterocephalus glaber]|uniref:Uncharacterized protein C7orf73 homolog isoform X1 n=1 Tax=Heterocephalus glaber TaxID=10181 RepID=A0AAX6TE65_HETGA|nr:uncharacterized protein C7orf73 homolog isoform X1 [Heterocephalus glaber]
MLQFLLGFTFGNVVGMYLAQNYDASITDNQFFLKLITSCFDLCRTLTTSWQAQRQLMFEAFRILSVVAISPWRTFLPLFFQ